jgi:integrase
MSERLTSKVVETVNSPAILWDDDLRVKGFGLRVHAGGAKSFFLNYRINGVERRITIGRYPTWSVTAAREEAKALRQRIDRGEDPANEKRERRTAPTMQDLVNRYIRDHMPTLSEGEHNDQRRMLAEIAGHLGKDRKVADVHFGDIEAMHRRITESGRPVRANRILGVASKAFTLSVRPLAGEDKPWRDAAAGNPCKGVARNREEGRERFFSQAELAAISDALAEYGESAPASNQALAKASADCIRLIMLTGCRPGEALRATWQEFDAAAGVWSKPSGHTKQRKIHTVPLAPAAIELIERRRQERDKATRKGSKPSEWVFPGAVPGEPIAALWHIWHFVRDRAGLGRDAYVYTLRHSFASVGAGGGASLLILGKLLGHTQQRTTQRYSHLSNHPLKEAVDRIGAVISGAGKAGAKVSTIKR